MEKNSGINRYVIIAAWSSLAVFVTAFLVISALVDAADTVLVRDLFYTVMGVVTVLALTAAAIKSRGRDRPIWILIAAAGALWATGDLTFRICEVTGMFGPRRVLCVPDIFYLAAYAALVAIVVLLADSTKKSGSKNQWTIIYPITVVVSAIVICGILSVFFPNGVAGGPITFYSIDFATTINYLYTALDFCIVAGLLVIILKHNSHFSRVWEGLFVIGLSTFTIADLSSSMFKPAGIYDPANLPTQIIMAMWLTGYGLLSMAAVYKLTGASPRK
jgi:hypothetical protein